MRLLSYIKETTEPTVVPVVTLINSIMPELYRILSKHSWNVDDEMLIKILNGVFKRHGIEFDLSLKRKSIKRLLGWGAFMLDGSMEIYIEPFKVSDYFRRFVKNNKYGDFFSIRKNQFLRDLFDVMTHEYIHAMQNLKSKGKFADVEQRDDDSAYTYLSDKHEIEAYAQQAAIEIGRFGKSDTVERYLNTFDRDDPALKRFFKKLIFYSEKGLEA